ncbi:secreted protein [Moelleriella libera RCEF 2490]|uniref:Secreted protein n=1 Tax=Moelleriella libera RCEF 2490 TaxID=1081109 RepID=A0A166NW68_9HYPO|nr:secreted protein [Moelleriella libera RCEF 2490]
MNAPLQAAWAAVDWARAGEIIRHTGAGWDEAEVQAFAGMLEKVHGTARYGTAGSKKQTLTRRSLVLMEASVSIAVFLDKRDIYDKSIERFKRSTAQYIYMKSDKPYPLLPQGITRAKLLSHWWNGQKEFKEDGMAMEVCRDLTHTGYGLASISHVAETARIQGLDLYKQDVGKRLLAGLEFQARYDKRGGAEKVPAWLCKGQLKLALEDVTEPAFSRLANKDNMPFTKKLTMAARPARANTLFVGLETLTHAQDVLTTQQNKVKSPWSFWRR